MLLPLLVSVRSRPAEGDPETGPGFADCGGCEPAEPEIVHPYTSPLWPLARARKSLQIVLQLSRAAGRRVVTLGDGNVVKPWDLVFPGDAV